MKDYSNYIKHSISMSKDMNFVKSIEFVLRTNIIGTIIESGTFIGMGSTTTIAEIIQKNKIKIDDFFTIEVDKKSFLKAKKNLKKFDFVTPIWGISINPITAIEFVKNDKAILKHEDYPEIYIDTLINPADFYINEINGQLSQTSLNNKNKFLKLFNMEKNNTIFQECVFENLITKIDLHKTPLILLDSAGGIGLLEFTTILELFGNRDFIIVLDDIHHLKHFRSLEIIENSEKFSLINLSKEEGWAIAKYSI